jgi:hypothetical protein
MNPDNPPPSDQPSLLKPNNGDEPAAAFSSGMPDPFARQKAEVESMKQSTNSLESDQPNATAAKTLGGYDKSTENIYRIDSPADGNGQQTAANPVPSQPITPPPPAPEPIAAQSPTPNPSSASDYLNQIAPQKSNSNKFFSGKILIIGGILAFALLATIIAAAVVNNVQQGSRETAVTVGTELTNLQTLVAYGKSNNVGPSKVVKAVAETNLIVLSRQRDLSEVFTLADPDNKPPAPAFVADLDSAKANSNLESVYADTLKEQLNATYIALQNLDQQTATTATKDTVEKAMEDIKELYRRLTE